MRMIELEGEHFLTVEEAAQTLGVKKATLYAYVSRGMLQSYRQGIKRQRLYRRREVEALLRLEPSRPRPGTAPRRNFPAPRPAGPRRPGPFRRAR